MTSIVIPLLNFGTVYRYTNEADPLDVLYGQEPGGQVAFGGSGVALPPDFNVYNAVNRGLMQFDTSVLVGMSIGKIELYRSWLVSPNDIEPSTSFNIIYSIGDFGASLDYNQTEFDGGTDCYSEAGLGSSFVSAEVLDLGAVGIAGINLTGLTTIKIRNPYNEDYPDNFPESNGSALYNVGLDPCYLIVSEPAYASPISLMAGA